MSISGEARPAALVWSVSALLIATGDALSARFGALAVRGELSGLTRAGSGHVYFTLKDATGGAGALRCAMFRRAASMVSVPLQEGLQVELRGRLAVYEARGELQMIVEALQRVGAGNLYEEFLRLRARLAAEGLFEEARKRPLPVFVRTVGVVTSLAGAALHDVVATLRRRAPHVRVVVYPSLVQGAEAPAALVAALGLAAQRDEVDALIVCRGGGSLEDLWAFNDERVVRALAALPFPVVSGVGHETDITLADLVADVRAATPTAAAECVAPERDALLEDLAAQAQRMQRRMAQRLQAGAQHTDNLALRLMRPGQALAHTRTRLQAAEARLMRGGERALARIRERLARSDDRLAMLAPQRVLERGFAWLQSADGRPVSTVAQLQPGAPVRAVLADGRAELRVEQIRPDD